MKTQIRTYGDRVYANFRGLNVTQDDVEPDSLLVYKKILPAYLDNCADKIKSKQMTDYLNENYFQD